MDTVLGVLAFAGIAVGHVTAVVAVHGAKQERAANPLGRWGARESHLEGACTDGCMGSRASHATDWRDRFDTVRAW